MEVVIAFVVVCAVVLAIGYPFWRPFPEPFAEPIGPAARAGLLAERKAQIYAAIRELGFDYRTDKLLEEDYREEVERLKRDAVAVVRELEELRSQPPRGPEALEEEIAARVEAMDSDAREGAEGRYCTQCGKQASTDDRFCASCGAAMRRS